MAIDWMKHPLNTREQQNVAKMMMKNGMAGYGAFWALNELLMSEETHQVEPDYNVLGYRLHCDAGLVKSVATEFGLYVFTEDGEYMHSELVDDQASHIDETSSKRSAAGKKGSSKRWQDKGNQIANAKQKDSKAMAIAKQVHGKPMASDSRLDETETKTNKEIKTSRPKSKTRTYDEDSQEYQLAADLWRRIQELNPDAKHPNLQKWADDIRKMHELDNRDWNKIARMIRWSQADDFWRANILSVAKLREKYDTMAAKANAEAARKPVQRRGARVEQLPAWLKDHDDAAPAPAPQPTVSQERINEGLAELRRLQSAGKQEGKA